MGLRLEDLTKGDVIRLFRTYAPDPPERIIAAYLITGKSEKIDESVNMLIGIREKLDGKPTASKRREYERRGRALMNRIDKLKDEMERLITLYHPELLTVSHARS